MDSAMTTASQKNCAKCGALLPDEDEGLCPSCGTPFGQSTVALNVNSDMLLQAHMENQEAERRKTESMRAPIPAPGNGGGLPIAALAAGGMVIILLIVILLYLVFT